MNKRTILVTAVVILIFALLVGVTPVRHMLWQGVTAVLPIDSPSDTTLSISPSSVATSTPVATSTYTITSPHPAQSHFWYEDNHQADSTGFPKDFLQRYEPGNMDKWKDTRSYMGVYIIPAIKFFAASESTTITDDFLTNRFIPSLKHSGTKLALDLTGTTHGERLQIQRLEIQAMQRIVSLGGTVDYAIFQSPLSKGYSDTSTITDPTRTMAQRITDVVASAERIHAVFPNIKFGIIDALVAHGDSYEEPYRDLKNAMVAKGLILDNIFFDQSLNLWYTSAGALDGVTLERSIEAEQYVHGLGVKVGREITSRSGGQTSPERYYYWVMRGFSDYQSAGGEADFIVALSWFKYPDYTIPEYATGNDYPAFRSFMGMVSLYTQHDTTPPTIALTAPQSGTIPVGATVSDNVGVVGMQFVKNFFKNFFFGN